ncbi:MAG: sulfotransferase, partial [Ghiorsea sp.]|nr:sulfotransferase [Ghiorsea sp.]
MKPDFICIGPEKTATTWLFRVLETHPDVWLPPYKELRFLNEGNTVPAHSLWTLFFSSHWHYKELRRIFLRSTVKFFLGRKTGDFSAWQAYRWVLYYMFRKHTFAWYDGLFDHESDKLTGDVTPNYYDIPESRIQQLSQSHPNVKILLFVRNPIARAWSKALMLGCNHAGRAFEDVSEDEWITVLDAIYREWTAYPEVID